MSSDSRAVAPGTAIAELVLCETCRRAPTDPGGSGDAPAEPARSSDPAALADPTRTADGTALAELVRRALAERDPALPVRVTQTRCLWVCKRSCAVHVRAAGKPGYVLCELEPTAVCAEGLVEYARLYAASPDGAVPFKTWPAAVRGHFLCRIPAVPEPTDTNEEPP